MSDEPIAFGWVKRIRRNWVLSSQGSMGVTVYLAIAFLLMAIFAPTSWHLAWVGAGLALLAFCLGGLERWVFFRFIRCPVCGFNATHGKSTDRLLNCSVAWSRLEQYQSCPRCGSNGHA
jgi:hypothetical protein